MQKTKPDPGANPCNCKDWHGWSMSFMQLLSGVFSSYPSPTAEQLSWEHIGTFLGDNIGVFLMVIIGIAVTIIYWIQNNVMFGNLQSTDSRHSILSILQLFFLLVFLVSLDWSVSWQHFLLLCPLSQGSLFLLNRHGRKSWCVWPEAGWQRWECSCLDGWCAVRADLRWWKYAESGISRSSRFYHSGVSGYNFGFWIT